VSFADFIVRRHGYNGPSRTPGRQTVGSFIEHAVPVNVRTRPRIDLARWTQTKVTYNVKDLMSLSDFAQAIFASLGRRRSPFISN
jgi:hypothetical protein